MSHALRVRGLKLKINRILYYRGVVARSTRAWIETHRSLRCVFETLVARSTRAWIETVDSSAQSSAGKSHALRVRGLKLLMPVLPDRRRVSHALRVRGLKPFCCSLSSFRYWSHALRVRGLKRQQLFQRFNAHVSHALRVRGLKRKRPHKADANDKVARSTRAWIETSRWNPKNRRFIVARSTRAWIETSRST